MLCLYGFIWVYHLLTTKPSESKPRKSKLSKSMNHLCRIVRTNLMETVPKTSTFTVWDVNGCWGIMEKIIELSMGDFPANHSAELSPEVTLRKEMTWLNHLDHPWDIHHPTLLIPPVLGVLTENDVANNGE